MCSITAGQADNGRGRTLHENKIPTAIHLSSVLRCQHSAAKCAALVVIDGPPSSTWPPLLSGAGLHAVPGYVCVIYGALIGSDSAARGAGLHKLQSFAKALNNHSLGLSASVKPSGGTSHPQLLHSCHTCTLASHAPPGGSAAPEGYVYNSICVLIWKKKLLGKRMRRLLYNTARTKLDFADATWLTKSPLQ